VGIARSHPHQLCLDEKPIINTGTFTSPAK
jgi:hypothetical protein